jgi:hypothetical protein
MRDRGLNRIGKSGITVASAAEKQLVAAAKLATLLSGATARSAQPFASIVRSDLSGGIA